MLVYPVFPMVGTVIQTLMYGVNAIWLLTAVSFLIIYFHLQNEQLTTDVLTGLNNRYKFNNYIENKLRNKTSGKKLFLVMIDMNKFKSINDNFGHLEGDKALITVSKLIIKAISRDDFLARLGGDEFVVVGERNIEEEILYTVNNIYNEVESYNKKYAKKYYISLSIGYSYSESNDLQSKDELLKKADIMMYKNKEQFVQLS